MFIILLDLLGLLELYDMEDHWAVLCLGEILLMWQWSFLLGLSGSSSASFCWSLCIVLELTLYFPLNFLFLQFESYSAHVLSTLPNASWTIPVRRNRLKIYPYTFKMIPSNITFTILTFYHATWIE